MYKYIGNGRFISGFPPEDIPDDVFGETAERLGIDVAALTTCQHEGMKDEDGNAIPVPDADRAAGSAHACVLYEHVDEEPSTTTATARSRRPDRTEAATE